MCQLQKNRATRYADQTFKLSAVAKQAVYSKYREQFARGISVEKCGKIGRQIQYISPDVTRSVNEFLVDPRLAP